MASSGKVKMNAKGMAYAFGRCPNLLAKEIKKGWVAGLNNFDSEFQSSRLRGRPGLNRITGNLANSFGGEVLGSRLDDLRLIYGTNVIYAPIHEFGGTITAKRSPYLKFQWAKGKWASKKSVTIPPRLHLLKTWQRHAVSPNGLIDHTNGGIKRALDGLKILSKRGMVDISI